MKETRSLPAELFAGRTLIFQLAKNDFKKKYAGSYLGPRLDVGTLFWA